MSHNPTRYRLFIPRKHIANYRVNFVTCNTESRNWNFDVCTVHLVQFIIQTNKCTTYIYIYIYKTYIYIYIYIKQCFVYRRYCYMSRCTRISRYTQIQEAPTYRIHQQDSPDSIYSHKANNFHVL